MAYQGINDEELRAKHMELENDLRRLGNERSRNPSRDDALGGYADQVAEAYGIVQAGWATQAASLKAVGRIGSGTVEWRLPTRFTQAQAIIADHEGAQRLLAAVQNLEYGMSVEEYQAERKGIHTEIGSILAELAFRKSEVAVAEAAVVYSDEIAKISGG